MFTIISLLLASAVAEADPPLVVRVDRDNIEITQSCTLEISAEPIIDADGNGVIHIAGDNITVEFKPEANHLHGATTDQLPDSFAGTGITIKGRNITLRGAKVSGFKVGFHAIECDGLTIENCHVSGNFQQRLKSTPKAEDPSDWLWPHANDNHEWITNYGAGVCVEKSNGVTLRNITAHHGQNGVILDRVNDSKVYDCDCSFLSGWGLAMWRSNKNVISRNAFDFCIRGYSHGVYNRGQDSAGILMFEQCCGNQFEENSATHCGDGFFGFAGKEALGEANPRDDLEWYKRRGCNDNILRRNDFSYAAAHGIEMTFSFGNWFIANRLVENAICGIWGGYSQQTDVENNIIQRNGEAGYGAERGGINIEHGFQNLISTNLFANNRCGISIWAKPNKTLEQGPWGMANHQGSRDNQFVGNQFDHDLVAVEIQNSTDTVVDFGRAGLANSANGVGTKLVADQSSQSTITGTFRGAMHIKSPPFPKSLGATKPFAARQGLAGRENIIMTEWGPWDHESPLLQFIQRFDHADEYQLRGAKTVPTAEQIESEGNVFIDVNDDRIFVRPNAENTILPYSFSFDADGQKLSASGTLTGGTWEVWTFASACDPREDVERWRREGTAAHHTLTADDLDFRFGTGGMTEARHLPAILPRDHFGVFASRKITFPAGKWRIKTISDDGIRVWMGKTLAIDDWTWHGPKEISHDFDLSEPRAIPLRVEYFELDGHAILSLQIQSQQ